MKITRKQMDLLLLITPSPLGAGLSITGAAMVLKISRQAATERLRNFRKKYPEGYKNWSSLRKAARRERRGLHNHLRTVHPGDFEKLAEKIIKKF